MQAAATGFLGREQLENGHPRFRVVELETGRVRIRSLTGSDMLAAVRLLEKDAALVDAVLIAMCVVDEAGQRLFRNTDVETGTFNSWDVRTLRALGAACDEHTGFTSAKFSWGQLEETVKN
jgi:hypothetical protein